MQHKLIALLAVLGLLGHEVAQARQDPPVLSQKRAELAWSELFAILTEKKISTKLPDGVKLEGEVLAVREEALVLIVQKTSNRKAYPNRSFLTFLALPAFAARTALVSECGSLPSVPSKACWQATYVVEKRCADL